MAIDLLIQETKGMSDEALMEVVRFVRFIKAENRNTNTPGKGQKRVAGKYSGQGWMAEDFDEPLEDFKEYM